MKVNSQNSFCAAIFIDADNNLNLAVHRPLASDKGAFHTRFRIPQPLYTKLYPFG